MKKEKQNSLLWGGVGGRQPTDGRSTDFNWFSRISHFCMNDFLIRLNWVSFPATISDLFSLLEVFQSIPIMNTSINSTFFIEV